MPLFKKLCRRSFGNRQAFLLLLESFLFKPVASWEKALP